MMRILLATDAWHPQINGVVRTLAMMAEAAKPLGVDVRFLTPQSFRTFAMPSYPDLRLALPCPAKIARLIAEARPDSIHIATEGPIGLLVRRYCRKQGMPFTTSFHTRFPDYISARAADSGVLDMGGAARVSWCQPGGDGGDAGACSDLRARGFRNVVLWPRGVDTGCFIRARSISACRARSFCASAASRSRRIRGLSRSRSARHQAYRRRRPARATLSRKSNT